MNQFSLADLEKFDPGAKRGRTNRRFCCPLCHGSKPLNESNRVLSVNTATGAWICFGGKCSATGKLTDFWKDTPRDFKGKLTRVRFKPPEPIENPQQAPAEPPPYDFEALYRALIEIEGTPGAEYLTARGIPTDLAKQSGVKYAPNIHGRKCITFPLHDDAGELAGISVRSITAEKWMRRYNKHHDGRQQAGVFSTPNAFDAPNLIIVEAPIDALSLALCDVPAVALIGCTLPNWIPRHFPMRSSILVATDNDAAGDKARPDLAAKFAEVGSRAHGFRPPTGKDWNDVLKSYGVTALRAKLLYARNPIGWESPSNLPPTTITPAPFPISHSKHIEQPTPAVNANVKPAKSIYPVQRVGNLDYAIRSVKVYTADMGPIKLPEPQDVMIAGHLCRGVTYLHPDNIDLFPPSKGS